MEDLDLLEKLIIKSKPVECTACKGRLQYIGGGKYRCQECGCEELDDFGKVKDYLEKNGPSPAVIVSQATGVKEEVINYFLKKGKVAIPEGSKYYLKCEKCGCSIKYGRFCPFCIRELAGGIQKMFNEDVGEIPKHELNTDSKGKMRFLNKR